MGLSKNISKTQPIWRAVTYPPGTCYHCLAHPVWPILTEFDLHQGDVAFIQYMWWAVLFETPPLKNLHLASQMNWSFTLGTKQTFPFWQCLTSWWQQHHTQSQKIQPERERERKEGRKKEREGEKGRKKGKKKERKKILPAPSVLIQSSVASLGLISRFYGIFKIRVYKK